VTINAIPTKLLLPPDVLIAMNLIQLHQIPLLPQKNSTSYFNTFVNSTYEYTVNKIVGTFTPQASLTSAATTPLNIYFRRGSAPNGDEYDASATLSNGVYTIELDQPIAGDWYLSIGNVNTAPVNGYFSLEYTVCNDGGYGPNCTQAIVDLTNQNNATLQVGTGDYQYFYVKSSELIVGVGTETLEDVAPTLLASYLNYPTNQSNLLMASGLTTNFIWTENPGDIIDTPWVVGVWANEGEEYYIWANQNCPSNCQGDDVFTNTTHGNCTLETGVCVCDDHYGDLTCTSTGLALVWIILIVIACAIVLAILIGVPIACYMRNQKRSRYETI